MRKKILLVDDSSTALLLAQMMLQGGSYVLITARDGLEAIDKALTERPDLILMDVIMPKLNGFEACRLLRRHEETRTTPIIMVTTRGEKHSLDEGFACGCSDYVVKPLDVNELLSKVRWHLGERPEEGPDYAA
jgi:CheY-like chemotaxis protein